VTDARRPCSLPAKAKVLAPLGEPAAQAATLVELGADTLVLRGPARLTIGALVAIDFELPGHPREINAIAKVVRPDDGRGQVRCELTLLPSFERQVVRRWAESDPPPRPAARNRVG
jgi:hypothetical protein